MGKHTDKLGSADDFRAPWETESGADAEIEKPKLKRLIFNLKLGEAKALDAVEDSKDQVAKLESDLADAKKDAAAANGEEAQKKIDRLERDLTAAKEKVTEMETAKEQADLRADVLKDLDPKYAKYVKGETREDLEKSLEEVKEDFGLTDPEDDEDEENEPEVRTRPRSRLRNGSDPDSGKPGEGEVDFDKIADGIVGNTIFG